MRPIFLSPHPDDAVLSCGGTIYQLAENGQRPLIITLFGGDRSPHAPVSDFARSLQARWQMSDDAPAARRDEDRAACDRLGAMLIHLPFADAVYRIDPVSGQALYASEEAIFGDVRDVGIIDLVTEALKGKLRPIGLENVRVFAPLTAGGHVDHMVTRAAAEALKIDLAYYEDYPYAEKPERLKHVWGPAKNAGAADGANDEWVSESIVLSAAALHAKIEAFLCHRSQISTFYQSDEEVAQRIRAYAAFVGDGLLVERYWHK